MSILAHDAIALPLAPSFPDSELQYILENSSAALLLSTSKFKQKAEAVLTGDAPHRPQLEVLEEIVTGGTSAENVKLESCPSSESGLMLYTSGTTNRPV